MILAATNPPERPWVRTRKGIKARSSKVQTVAMQRAAVWSGFQCCFIVGCIVMYYYHDAVGRGAFESWQIAICSGWRCSAWRGARPAGSLCKLPLPMMKMKMIVWEMVQEWFAKVSIADSLIKYFTQKLWWNSDTFKFGTKQCKCLVCTYLQKLNTMRVHACLFCSPLISFRVFLCQLTSAPPHSIP